MSKQNIFRYIANVLVNNFKNNKNKIVFKYNYPIYAVRYCTDDTGTFHLDKWEERRNKDTGAIEYVITYSKLNPKSTLFNDTEHYLLEKYDRKGYGNNEPVSTKFLNINDKYRQELDCPNYNKDEDDDYNPCPYNTNEKFVLPLEDRCSYQLFYNSLGFDTYEEFQAYLEAHPKTFQLRVDRLYRKFLEKIETREYANGYLY